MKFDSMITALKASILAATGITSVKVGYLYDLNTGQATFPMVLIIPPKMVKAEPGNDSEKDYKMKWYLIKLDRGATGNPMTEDERSTAWADLEYKNSLIMQKIRETPSNYKVIGGYTVDFNSLSSGNLITTPVVWVEVECTLRTDHCSWL